MRMYTHIYMLINMREEVNRHREFFSLKRPSICELGDILVSCYDTNLSWTGCKRPSLRNFHQIGCL